MPESLQDILLYSTGVFFVLALLILLISLRLFRRSRRDVFWRRRREAGQRGWRLFLLASALLVFSAAACVSSFLLSIFSEEPEPTMTNVALSDTDRTAPVVDLETASETDVLPSPTPGEGEGMPSSTPTESSASPTPVPTVVVIITATPPSTTPTNTPFATFTPQVTPLVSSVTPGPNASLTITALDSQISDAFTPVEPRTQFRAGVTRLYLFVDFRDMRQGALWRRELYRDGELVDGNAYLWGSESDGSSYFFFGSDSGFMPGSYEIRLYIGEGGAPVDVAAFTVVEPS